MRVHAPDEWLTNRGWLAIRFVESADDVDHTEDGDDPGRECALSKYVAIALTFTVGAFIYLVFVQQLLLLQPSWRG